MIVVSRGWRLRRIYYIRSHYLGKIGLTPAVSCKAACVTLAETKRVADNVGKVIEAASLTLRQSRQRQKW